MRWLANKLMRLLGWRFTGERPPHAKFVAIGAPHTTNWDFIVFLAVVHHFRVPARAIGKHTLFRWPFGGLMRRLGLIPVRRDSSEGLVQQMVAEFAKAEEMALVIAPEGTRKRTEYWRSGFYHIATAAEVPIALTFIDFPNKTAGIGPTVHPSGDIATDMNLIREFYAPIHGRRPENQGPIRLRDEPA
ncbi:MAG: lysophospholipid acyltransferase family protein [Acidimicrobiia bacterium]|nr:lysophospholipid acyltransferase family protein [Acidimicrobiia bacterium]